MLVNWVHCHCHGLRLVLLDYHTSHKPWKLQCSGRFGRWQEPMWKSDMGNLMPQGVEVGALSQGDGLIDYPSFGYVINSVAKKLFFWQIHNYHMTQHDTCLTFTYFPCLLSVVNDATRKWLDAWVVSSNRMGSIIGCLFCCLVKKFGGEFILLHFISSALLIWP